MQKSAIVIAVLALAACSSAEAELARMQDVPVVVSIDAAGNDVIAYEPDETVPVDRTGPDLFPSTVATAEPSPTSPGQPPQPDEGDDDGDAGGAGGAGSTTTEPPVDTGVPVIEPTVLERFPHDQNAFTQGLAYVDGVLIESLGLLGESARRRVAPATGEVITSARLDSDLFGAGIDVTAGGQVIQLTWQQGVAIVSDLTTMLELSRFTYEGEGWGLCQLDSGALVMSNGSGFLTLRDVETFAVQGELEVTLDGDPTQNLNELECVGDSIFANVWLESVIYDIDAATGEVNRVIDAAALVPGDLGPDDVLNGIAYRPDTDTFFLTGKRWTVMYEVSFG